MLRGIGPTGQAPDPSRHRSPPRRGRFENVRRVGLCFLIAAVVGSSCGCGFFERDEPLPVVSREVTGPRIVVLPFENAGPESDAFFADGMTEEIEERLGAVTGLIVISDSGGTVTEDSDDAIRRIGDELGAEYVLSGTVQRSSAGAAEPRLLAGFSLVRVNDSEVLWSESYDRSPADVFAVQADVALTVLDRLGVDIPSATRAVLERHTTDNMAAYEAYLQGLPNRWSFELRELRTAGESFNRAVELDPAFASAYVALSENHSQIFHFRGDRSPQRLANAIAAALRALEIQPDLPEGHRALGLYYYWGQRNYKQALSEFSLAAAGRPNDPLIISSIGLVLRRQGRWQEAMDAFIRVRQLDPKDDINAVDLASTCGRMRRYEDGIKHCRRAIDLAPDDIFPYILLAKTLRTSNGSIDGAREVLEAMPDKDPVQQGYSRFEQALYERDYPAALKWLAPTDELTSDPINEEIFARQLAECEGRVLAGEPAAGGGACDQARVLLERAREISPVDPAVHSALGWSYALLGEKTSAIASGERAVELLPVSADAMAGHSFLVRLAKIYAWSGEPFSAVKTIEKALATPGWLSVSTLELDPDWDPLRADPRFQELLRMHRQSD